MAGISIGLEVGVLGEFSDSLDGADNCAGTGPPWITLDSS